MNSAALAIAIATIFGLSTLFASDELTTTTSEIQIASIFDLSSKFPELNK